MLSSTAPREEDIDGQYYFQLQDIAHNLLKVNQYDGTSLDDLVHIRCQLDCIKRDFEGSLNLKLQMKRLYSITNHKLKELKDERGEDFETMRKTLGGEFSVLSPMIKHPHTQSMK